jgi:hypothetical protein
MTIRIHNHVITVNTQPIAEYHVPHDGQINVVVDGDPIGTLYNRKWGVEASLYAYRLSDQTHDGIESLLNQWTGHTRRLKGYTGRDALRMIARALVDDKTQDTDKQGTQTQAGDTEELNIRPGRPLAPAAVDAPNFPGERLVVS